MFSPSVERPAQNVRSSRRRQRPSNDSIIAQQPKAKRQRSALSEQTFLPPNATNEPSLEMEEVKSNKLVPVTRRALSRTSSDGPGSMGQVKDIVVRGKKAKTSERTGRGDGSVVLTTNETYTVSKLPALPDRLRTDIRGYQHGAIYSDTGYALALTHTHALVWPYALNIPSPETFTFTLPYPSKHVTDPLPIGSLVSAAASSNEPGLVVVEPTSGKITYWESIASAATLDLIRQQRNGVELTIPGMLSGETVSQILNAESAGFVLGFSSGRVAYMSVRDSQGRPSISLQFLRATGGQTNGGIFGSIRHALSSSAWKGEIAAMRAGSPTTVGERTVVVATTKGRLQAWNVHRGGYNILQAEAEGRETIVMAIKAAVPSLAEAFVESFELIDLSFTPTSLMASQLDEADGLHLLLLTSLTSRQTSCYSLIEVVLKQGKLSVFNVKPLKSYTTPINKSALSRPKLYLPNPALVAFIVFDKAVLVVSMAKQPESPDLQLRAESHLIPPSFEDVIDFREDPNVEIVGSGMEEPHGPVGSNDDAKSRRHKAKYPATVLLVRSGGIVRIAATDAAKLSSIEAPQVTAKSKLEQAVFFGKLDQTPLSFSVRPELKFSPKEVGEAALALSLDILDSKTPHIPSVPASIEQNLRKRSTALYELAEYLKASGVVLDRSTRWTLLWHAEKVAAATLIWKNYDAGLNAKPEGEKRGILTEIVEFIHEDYKTEPVPEAGELDRVRHWFINDISQLDVAVSWAYQVIKYMWQDGQKHSAYVMRILSEANDLVLGAMDGAFNFRSANLELYGLEDEELRYGVLMGDYEGLPEIWTSTVYVVESLRKLAILATGLVTEFYEGHTGEGGGEGQPDARTINKLRHELPNILDVALRSSSERVKWDTAQESHELQIQGEQLTALQTTTEFDEIMKLATRLDLSEEAMALAEKHEILPTLASVVMLEMKVSDIKVQETHSLTELQVWEDRSAAVHARCNRYFDKFGTGWATALFECYIRTNSISSLLDNHPDQQELLTDFLRSRPEYAKIAWIHESSREKNLAEASKELLDLGLNHEQHVWSKKVELSLGKLAHLANQQHNHADMALALDDASAELNTVDRHLELIKVQDTLYEYVFPSIRNAIDEGAELQLAIETHGPPGLKKKKALSAIFEEGMGQLIRNEAMDAYALIDLLTLMKDDGYPEESDSNLFGAQFCLALQAARYGLSNKEDQVISQRVIWRRCLLKDNWAVINKTGGKGDEEVSNQLRSTALYSTFGACFEKRIFGPDSPIRYMSPHELLGAGSDELDSRIGKLEDNVKARVMADMEAEDKLLRPAIEGSRLDKWYQGVLDLGKQDFEHLVHDETDGGEKMRGIAQKLQEIEKSIAEAEQKKAHALLHAKPRYQGRLKAIDSGADFRQSLRQH